MMDARAAMHPVMNKTGPPDSGSLLTRRVGKLRALPKTADRHFMSEQYVTLA
jgi:hypothetical protein